MVLLWRTLCSLSLTVCDARITKDQECPSVPSIQEQDTTPLNISHHNTQRGFSAHPDSSDEENQPLNPSLIPTLFTPIVPTWPFGIRRQSTPSNPVPPRPPTPMSSSTPEFKVALPADFSGDPADFIRWIKAMRAYFTINSKLYSTDEIKVMTTLNKMSKGRGIDFSKMWYDRISNATIDTKEKTFDKFAKNFKTTFYPFDIKATAHFNLAKLTQKTFWEEDGTFNDSFQKFITNFQNLAAKAGISDKTTLINHFSLGIDQQITTMILSMSTIPTTLNEWIEKAKTFHAQKMCIAAIRGRKGNPSFFTSRNPPPCDLNAMDIDATSLTKLTPAERAHCIREKLCFRCRKPGHSASQHNVTRASQTVKEREQRVLPSRT